jgi:hypothetical protein
VPVLTREFEARGPQTVLAKRCRPKLGAFGKGVPGGGVVIQVAHNFRATAFKFSPARGPAEYEPGTVEEPTVVSIYGH